ELMGTLREVDGRRCSWIAVRMHGRSGIVRTERRILKDGTQSDGVLRTSAEILLRTLMDGSECTELQVEMGGLSIAAPEQMSFVPERVSPYSIARTVEQRYPRTMHRVQMKDPDAYLREQQWMLVPYSPLPVTVSS
ncbi:MAG: hypothetical protein ACKOB6_01310, partial [Candidatus Kapaibacterium sp.]